MGSVRRPAGLACFVMAAALLIFSSPAVAQGSITVIDSGSSDDLVPPPAPLCDDLVFITEVTFSPNGVPLGIPRLGVGPSLVTSYIVPNFEPIGPSIIALDEVITFDGHAGRDIWPAQLNERVKFEFLLDGVVQATTPFTPDLPDDSVSAWLDVDLGTYELPNGADQLRIVHFGDPDNTDSVVVSALCGTSVDIPDSRTTTTVPAATVPPTTAPDSDTTVRDTTVRDTTVRDTTDPDTTVPDPTVGDTTVPGPTVTPTTVTPTTAAPTTAPPTTDGRTTIAPTTIAPTTIPDTTVAPTTVTPTSVAVTVAPTTEVRNTVAPTTAAPTTVAPTTAAPTTAAPTTAAPTTATPTTEASTTTAPTTEAPTTTAAAANDDVEVEVEGKVETRSGDLLAATGSANGLGYSLIAAGLVILGCALLLQSKDPEELFA